jgi:hypothetical protein
MGTRIRATLYLLFGLWWIIAIEISFMAEWEGAALEVKTAVILYFIELLKMLPGFICIELGLKKLRWLRSQTQSNQ